MPARQPRYRISFADADGELMECPTGVDPVVESDVPLPIANAGDVVEILGDDTPYRVVGRRITYGPNGVNVRLCLEPIAELQPPPPWDAERYSEMI